MIDKEKILNALDDFTDDYGTSFSSCYTEETSIIEDALDMYYEKLKEDKIKKYCSIKNREVYNQAIDDFTDGINEILKDNAIYNMDCINTLVNQLKVKDIEHYKVIGNMFDNPELYKREKTYCKDSNDYER